MDGVKVDGRRKAEWMDGRMDKQTERKPTN